MLLRATSFRVSAATRLDASADNACWGYPIMVTSSTIQAAALGKALLNFLTM